MPLLRLRLPRRLINTGADEPVLCFRGAFAQGKGQLMSVEDFEKASDGSVADCGRIEPFAEGAPWLAREDWGCGALNYHTGIDPEMWVLGVLGSVCLGISSAFLRVLSGQIRDQGTIAIVPLLIFGLLGIGLTV